MFRSNNNYYWTSYFNWSNISNNAIKNFSTSIMRGNTGITSRSSLANGQTNSDVYYPQDNTSVLSISLYTISQTSFGNGFSIFMQTIDISNKTGPHYYVSRVNVEITNIYYGNVRFLELKSLKKLFL